MAKYKPGAALVELAIVITLLMLILLGICEFSLIFKDYLTLAQAAREGARSASLAATTTTIKNRIVATAPTITVDPNKITLEYQTTGGSWAPLGDSGYQNNAPPGSLIRVTVKYDHPLVTGFVIPNQTVRTLTAIMIMRRE